jgi:heterodisulfide reductase subunit A
VATGYDEFDPNLKPELAYGVYDNVITGLEMERLCSASGPTLGKIEIGGKEPKDFVFIQCVGSRDETVGNEYCSRVCCMYTAKQAHLVREKIPDANITVFYMDIRAFGKGFEEFYDRVRKENVIYRRGSVSEIYRKGGKLIVRGEDTLLGEPLEVPADLVVLAAGLVARPSTDGVAGLLKLSKSSDRFLMEAHPKLRPVDTAADGVFLAGCCQGPKDIPDAVAQAKGAAASAIVPMSRGTVRVEALTAVIDEDLCSGCRLCNGLCPYGALTYDEEDGVTKANEALCKGCGTCASACPSGAISMSHFTSEQMLAQVLALIGGYVGGR